jgi:hypothetical protein
MLVVRLVGVAFVLLLGFGEGLVLCGILQIVHLSSIDGAAHVIPLHPKPSENDSWIVNSHIDLETWNEVINEDEEYSSDGTDSGEEDNELDLEGEPPELSAWLGREELER